MEAAGNGVVFRVRVQRKIVGTVLVVWRRLCLALQNPLWKPKPIARRGRLCWLSRLSILCGDPHFSQFALASAKYCSKFLPQGREEMGRQVRCERVNHPVATAWLRNWARTASRMLS